MSSIGHLTKNTYEIENQDFGKYYRGLYPYDLNLKPGSELSNALVELVMDRAEASQRFMSPKYSKWDEIRKTLNFYTPTSQYEAELKNKDERFPISIVVPESSAIRETILTYLIRVYGDTLLRYDAQEPGDELGVMLGEIIINNMIKQDKGLLEVITSWSDSLICGFGALAVGWRAIEGKKLQLQETGYSDPFTGTWIPTGSARTVVNGIVREGLHFEAIDPYCYYPDPAVDIYRVHEGSFVQWKRFDTYDRLRILESMPENGVFNVRYLEKIDGHSRIGLDESTIVDPQGYFTDSDRYSGPSNRIDQITGYHIIYPGQLPGMRGDRPEIWLVTVAADKVVIEFSPIFASNGMFPVAVCAPDAMGHEICPVSRMEMCSGMQAAMNFYYNSNLMNIVQMLKNPVIFDPKVISEWDLKKGRGLVKTRELAWGKDIRASVMELKVQNATQDRMNDLMLTRDLLRNSAGAPDSLQGIQRTKGERVTATEFTDTMTSAMARLEKTARIIGIQQIQDVGLLSFLLVQQYMTEPSYIRAIGEYEERLRMEFGILDNKLSVSPLELAVPFDVLASSGGIDNLSADPQNLLTLFSIAAKSPEIVPGLSLSRFFLRLARRLGEKDFQTLIDKNPVQVLPTEEVAAEAEAGNIVPLDFGASA